MNRLVWIMMIMWLLCSIANAEMITNLVGIVDKDLYFLKLDYKNFVIDFNHKILMQEPMLKVEFSTKRNGEVLVFFGSDGKCNKVCLYSNSGEELKEVSNDCDTLFVRDMISDGNYVIGSNANMGQVIKNNKIICELGRANYFGINGDWVYYARSTDRGTAFPMYKLNLISREKIKLADKLYVFGGLEIFNPFEIYYENCYGEGGNVVNRMWAENGVYREERLIDGYLIRHIEGFNKEYVFTFGNIVHKDDWKDDWICGGVPKLFRLSDNKIIECESNVDEIENMGDKIFNFDLL